MSGDGSRPGSGCLVRLALGLLALVGLAFGSYVVVEAWMLARLDEALERVRESGAPTSIASVRLPPPRPGADALPVLRRVAEWNARHVTEELVLDGLEGDPLAVEPGALDALRLAADVLAPARDELRAAAPLARLDPRRHRPALDGSMAEDLPFAGILVATRAFATSARVAAIDGRPDDALRETLEALATARLAEDVPMLFAHYLLVHALQLPLDAAQELALRAPEGVDLAPLASELATLDVREGLRRGLLAERAFGIEIFETLRAGGTVELDGVPDDASPNFGTYPRLFVVADAVRYLERFEDGFERMRLPLHESLARRDAPADGFDPAARLGGPLAALVTPLRTGAEEASAAATVRVAIVRLALEARALSPAERERRLAGLIDPFTGEPVRTAPELRGHLRVWSVGVDGVDAGGTRDPDDDVVGWLPAR